MNRALRGVLVAVTLTLTSAAAAQADRTESTSFGIGVTSGTVLGEHLMGIGGQFDIPFAAGKRSAHVSGAYEFGNYKDEDSAPPPTTYETNTTGYRFAIGVDHQMAIGDRGLIYIGPGISYASHKYKQKITGAQDQTSEPYKVWGIPCRLGVAIAATETVEAFGQVEQTFGWGSIEQGTEKITQTDVLTGFTLGVRFVFANRQ